MANLSTYSKNALANWLVGGSTMPTVPTVYLALYDGDPASGGSDITATVCTNRLALSGGSMSTSSGGGKSSSNASDLVFTASAAGGGTWTYVAAYDASTSGNLLWSKSIVSQTIVAGNAVKIIASNLTITAATDASGYLGDYLVNWMAGVAGFPTGLNRYLGLFNGDPLAGGSEVTTLVRAGGRISIVAAMAAASGGASTNGTALSYGVAAVGTPVSHLANYDTASVGNLLTSHALTGGSQTVVGGNPVVIPASSLTIQAA